ncbi:hypothetical protein HPP92_015962 [Vanilla planifolia]|uniref:CCT domain-containing protein n=1 Tax=Vanilla planifolia TaxID=51239 RepID=A0A835UTR5_VANPL|nr:hypothetical protein HPP92_015962 [Vanilla planifolia]
MRKRARWYCGADDAFLCQACDAYVHTANSLAGRHQRLRLHTSSPTNTTHSPPVSWRKRKARTPRPYQLSKTDLVSPDLEKNRKNSNNEMEEDEEESCEVQLICRVPELEEFCSPLTLEAPLPPPASAAAETEMSGYFLDSETGLMGMAELEVDCLLGLGLDDERESTLYMDELSPSADLCAVKIEQGFQETGLFQGEQSSGEDRKEGGGGKVSRVGLRLDYDAVIAAWLQKGCSPWATGGGRPHLRSPELYDFMCFLDCLFRVMLRREGAEGASWSEGRWGASGGEEREARVSRYREKRRTRLFVKKIRYEVRKLNAEKRPRIKGRFVKRAAGSVVSDQAGYPYQLYST